MKYSTAVSSSRRKSRKVSFLEEGRGDGGQRAAEARGRRVPAPPPAARSACASPGGNAAPQPAHAPSGCPPRPSRACQDHACVPTAVLAWAPSLDGAPKAAHSQGGTAPRRRRRPPSPSRRAPHAPTFSLHHPPPGPLHGPFGRPPQADVHAAVRGAAGEALGEFQEERSADFSLALGEGAWERARAGGPRCPARSRSGMRAHIAGCANPARRADLLYRAPPPPGVPRRQKPPLEPIACFLLTLPSPPPLPSGPRHPRPEG